MKQAPAGGNRAAPFVSDSITSSPRVLSEPSASAQSNSSQLVDGILIAKFWKSARNRRDSINVTLKSYEGFAFLDCRLHTTSETGHSVPTHKGCTVGMRQLTEFRDAIDKAHAHAVELGLIERDKS